ncbi:hypothetical protein [Paenibacillus prosopidis]|uniref:Uncharacterized protein n=1 Tax=Paenibacillus prosopidis TaxID=630520 RepID=A0A368W8D3_9BACL|nr:hypothetical protein [Paenibacillus prosopidis]RCW49535.1 hypothetical protein DFP97_104193 [Paenibacillus prosopidis]
MPGFDAFGNINHPLVTADIAENGSRNGVLYYSTTSTRTVAANGFLSFQLSNPTTANRVALVVRAFSGGQANATQFFLRNGTLNGGVTLSGFNGNFGFPDMSQMIPSFSISAVNPVTGGVTITSVLQVGGPPVNETAGRIIVPPGNRFIVSLQNNAGANTFSISVSWVEQ